MSSTLFSPSWYRVAALRPRLRPHAQVHRHEYRGRRWYLVRDPLSGRNHRFSPVAHTIIGLMDGRRSLEDIWNGAAQILGDDAPTQDETIRLLAQLHGADLLQCDVPPDGQELLRRHADQRRLGWKRNFGNPLALRFPLFDPDLFLARAMPVVRPLFTPFAAIVWVAVVAAALLLATAHREALLGPALESAFAPHNLLPLWLSYTAVKTLHEFGHAFAVKRWGGEVHEMGVSLLVLMPLPYVDATAASVFRDRGQRILVGAAGMLVELFLAALATFVWISVEPGAIRLLAFDIMLIGSVSTLFFNGNPLLRFDGYYILSDAIGIPNLASRSNRYLGYLCRRYLFGSANADSPANGPGERGWFVVYGLAAFAYKIFITFVIAVFVAGKLFFVGMLLALWALLALIVLPVVRMLKFLAFDPEIAHRRARAMAVAAAGLGSVLALTLVLPFPLATRAEGVVWLPEQSQLRAGTACEIETLLAPPNTAVEAGAPLLRCADPFLGARIDLLEARLRELRGRHIALWAIDRVAADIVGDEIRSVEAALADAEGRAGELTIRSPVAGTWIAPRFQDLPGRFVEQGELLGHVIDFAQVTARIVVPQRDVDLVRQRTREVELRLAEQLSVRLPARIERELPAASHRLPSPALGSVGGGRFEVDPADKDGVTTAKKIFQFDLAFPEDALAGFVGGRVYARLDHGAEPLGRRWYRALRRLFLSKFDV